MTSEQAAALRIVGRWVRTDPVAGGVYLNSPILSAEESATIRAALAGLDEPERKPVAEQAPTATPSGLRVVNAALAAGFEIERHASAQDYYWHELRDSGSRRLTVRSALGTGRFLHAAASWPIVGGQYKTTTASAVIEALAVPPTTTRRGTAS